ncbi:MAG: hypothetical protein SOZ59_07075 [Candidatus Limivivens sp.]|nr:hypothetical protein [Candidatus Limivivens sp.]
MLSTLLKKQMTEIFRSYIYDAKKNRSRSKAGTIAYLILFVGIMVGLLGGLFAYLSLSICGALTAVGMDWLYFTLMGLLAVLLGVFGSVFNTYSCLYLSKDNDLMLSLPIPVNVIMASRLLSVYLMGLMYSLVVILPAVIVYWAIVSVSAGVIIGCLLLVLLISVFVLTLSCALGWVVAKISLKLKNKSFITVVVSLVFIGGYYFFYFKAQILIQDLLANAAVYGEKVKGTAYPLYLFGRVGTGDAFAMTVVSAVILALFALMWVLISRSFLKIAASSGHTARKVYKERAMKQKDITLALLGKEFGRFTSSSNYMLNCGLGILLLPVCGVLLLWNGGAVISVLNEVCSERAGCIPVLLSAAVCMLASMNDMAAPSVSLEGRSLWLMQSLPVTPWQILRAKICMQLLLTGIPALFCMVCIAFIYPYTPLELFSAVLVPTSYVLLSALFGLFLGLKMPILNWTSEITPIKQSACVTIALFSGFVYTALLCAGFMLMNGWKLGFVGYMSGFGVLTLVLCIVLYFWLKKRGCNLFAAI